jgi:hypothetical protein
VVIDWKTITRERDGEVTEIPAGFRPLILIICSYHKQTGGIRNYDETSSIFSSISDPLKSSLKDRRKEIFQLLRSGKIFWAQQDENENEFNELLVPGPDLGGESEDGYYLTAIERYSGEDSRFYSKLGLNGKEILTHPLVKSLVISGLYGFVTPFEQIQCYSVPVEWNSNIQKIWQRDKILTKILLEYLKKHQITHIFDFTMREDYRDMIDWNLIRENHSIQVRYCFSRKGAGNDALSDGGKFFRDISSNQIFQTLVDIPLDQNPKNHPDHIIYSRTVPYEWDGFPTERKRIPTSFGILFYDTIPDLETRQIFESAEKIMKILYNAEDVGKDPGSVFFMYYGKGLEVLLHNSISKNIIAIIQRKYPDGINRYYPSLPPTLQKLLDDTNPETISLGEWHFVEGQWNGTNPIVSIAREYLSKNVSRYYPDIVAACEHVRKYRNSADHQKITTIDEFLSVRRNIIRHINTCIFNLCGEEVRLNHYRQLLRSGTEEEIKEAISYLEKQKDFTSAARIAVFLLSIDSSIRLKSIKALGAIGDPSIIPSLNQAAENGTAKEKQFVLESITNILNRSGDHKRKEE